MKIILILDDNEVIRQSFVDFFEDSSWLVYQADSTERALEILDSTIGQIQIGLVDIRLPGRDGDTFIREALVKTTTMSFAVCTGVPNYQLPQDLARDNRVLNDFYKKPVSDLHMLEIDLHTFINRSIEVGD